MARQSIKPLKRRVKRFFKGEKLLPDTRVAVWQELRLLYVRIPKSGNTSIMRSIDGTVKTRMWGDDIRAMDDSWTSFSFVRNPWARIVSAYRDKATLESNSPRMHDGVFQGFVDAGIPVYPGMGFDAFCEVVCAIPDEKTDKHMRSQSSFIIADGEPIVQMVGRLENMAQDWRAIMERARIDLELLHLNRTDSAGKRHYSEYFDSPRLVNLVGDRYAEDIRRFNYDFQAP